MKAKKVTITIEMICTPEELETVGNKFILAENRFKAIYHTRLFLL